MTQIRRHANFVSDPEGRSHRTWLERSWAADIHSSKPLGWIMLNPSVADGEGDDRTVTKCMGFANRLGYNGIIILNLFSLVSTDPSALMKPGTVDLGKENDFKMASMLKRVEAVICGWGSNEAAPVGVEQLKLRLQRIGTLRENRITTELTLPQKKHVTDFLRLGELTQSGMPRHPLYLSYSIPTYDYRFR